MNIPSSEAREQSHLAREAARERLGRAIRKRRHDLGWTLAELAKASGLSVSLLSQVERGKVDPSLDSLRDIAYGLATTPFTLLDDGHVRSHTIRSGTGLHLEQPSADVAYELLSPSFDGAFQVAIARLKAGGATMKTPRPHPGEEGAFALEGTVYVEIGNETVRLEPGDFVTYDPRIPHRAYTDDQGPAAVLFVVSPPYL